MSGGLPKAKPIIDAKGVAELKVKARAIPRAPVPIGLEARGVARPNPDQAPKVVEAPVKREKREERASEPERPKTRDELMAAYRFVCVKCGVEQSMSNLASDTPRDGSWCVECEPSRKLLWAPPPIPETTGLQSGTLPPAKVARTNGKKGLPRTLAEKITDPAQWFEWKNPPKWARCSVNTWARRGLPVKSYQTPDGRLIVCHKDAVPA